MDWTPGFWLNRLNHFRQEVDYMPDKKLAIAMEKSQSEHYAVVELRWKETLPELVIAYCDEESLGKLFAAPNIIGIVLSSQAAVAGVQNGSSSDTDCKKFSKWQTSKQGASPVRPPSFGLSEIRRIGFETVRRAVASGILMFYSTNILGAAIRAIVGA